MEHSPTRRSLLLAAVAAPFVAACTSAPVADQGRAHTAQAELTALEKASNGRLGVAALDTSNGVRIAHHARERFPLCGTYAVAAAAAILARGSLDASLLPRRILYRRYEIVAGSPITESHVDTGMTIEQLCAAMLQSGDKGAGNLLMGVLGGPQAVTAFVRASGDTSFRLDHWEPELNNAAPGDERDTSTPVEMVDTLQRLLLGDTLQEPQRARLTEWMVGGARGADRHRGRRAARLAHRRQGRHGRLRHDDRRRRAVAAVACADRDGRVVHAAAGRRGGSRGRRRVGGAHRGGRAHRDGLSVPRLAQSRRLAYRVGQCAPGSARGPSAPFFRLPSSCADFRPCMRCRSSRRWPATAASRARPSSCASRRAR
ncbi:class A beta-lactamase [Burkholderia sp. AU31652]|uniref:class A beta-lactamase n=1 Tax=Burkholderia sp. AU31652 TaxID=2015354 RepID=UPI003F8D47CC